VNRLLWTLLPAALLAGLALAQQQAPPPDAPPAAETATVPEDDVPFLDELPADAPQDAGPAAPSASAPAENGEEVQDERLPPLPPERRSTGPTPQRFDPSEEVRADFPVSFPIDI